MAVVKRKPKQPPRSALAELDQLVSIVSRLEANCRDNWAQLNAWHNDPANDVQALAARVNGHGSLIEGLNTRLNALEPDEDDDGRPEPLYHGAEAFEQMSKRIDEGLGEVQAAIVDLDRRVNSAEPETRDRITKLRYDHNQLAMEIREVYRRELDEVKAQLGEWSRENKMDNLTVEYRLKRLAEDWDGDGLTKTVIALRDEIRDIKDRLGGWEPDTSDIPEAGEAWFKQAKLVRPGSIAPIPASPRLIIFQVWWPGQAPPDPVRDIRPLALKPEDIFRVKPSSHANFTEIEVLQPVLRDTSNMQRAGIEPTIYSFVVEGEFAEIVAKINS